MNSIVFTIPDNEWISANDRLHWAAKARRTAALVERAKYQSLNAMRRGELRACFGRVRVVAGIQYRAGRVDPANAYPTIKALIDGMTQVGCGKTTTQHTCSAPTCAEYPEDHPRTATRWQS